MDQFENFESPGGRPETESNYVSDSAELPEGHEMQGQTNLQWPQESRYMRLYADFLRERKNNPAMDVPDKNIEIIVNNVHNAQSTEGKRRNLLFMIKALYGSTVHMTGFRAMDKKAAKHYRKLNLSEESMKMLEKMSFKPELLAENDGTLSLPVFTSMAQLRGSRFSVSTMTLIECCNMVRALPDCEKITINPHTARFHIDSEMILASYAYNAYYKTGISANSNFPPYDYDAVALIRDLAADLYENHKDCSEDEIDKCFEFFTHYWIRKTVRLSLPYLNYGEISMRPAKQFDTLPETEISKRLTKLFHSIPETNVKKAVETCRAFAQKFITGIKQRDETHFAGGEGNRKTKKGEGMAQAAEERFDRSTKKHRHRYSLDNQRLCFLTFFMTERNELDSVSFDVEKADDYHYQISADQIPPLCAALGCANTEAGMVEALANMVASCSNPVDVGSFLMENGVRFKTHSFPDYSDLTTI